MTVYILLVVFLLAASLLLHGNERHNKKFIIVAFILLFIVMGLRDVYAFGSDASGSYGSYPVIFRRTGRTAWGALSGKGENNYNIAFVVITKLLFEITGGDYQLYITIISLFVVASYMRFIYKYSTSPIVSIICFMGLLYYTMLFDVLKQALALSVLLFAFDAVVERRPYKFLILTLIASMFHFPALFFLPAYWNGRMKVGRNYILLLTIVMVLTFLFRNQLLNLMLRTYSGGSGGASMSGIRFLRSKVLIMIAIVVMAIVIRPPSPGDSVYNSLLLFAGVAIVFQTFCGYNNIFERLADYYFHTSIILIPYIFERGLKYESNVQVAQNERMLSYATVIICAFSIWRFLSFVNSAWYFQSYRFFWQR